MKEALKELKANFVGKTFTKSGWDRDYDCYVNGLVVDVKEGLSNNHVEIILYNPQNEKLEKQGEYLSEMKILAEKGVFESGTEMLLNHEFRYSIK